MKLTTVLATLGLAAFILQPSGFQAFRLSAQSAVTLTVPDSPPGRAIPADFAGLSVGATAIVKNSGDVKGYLFSASNTQVITLFKNAALRHLRMGGSSVEGAKASVPDHETIDNLFAFARAADLKVIYTLRLLNGNPRVAASDAKYIWEKHRDRLDLFSIGNEPDIKTYKLPPAGTSTDLTIKDYETYLAAWKRFAAAVLAAVPNAKFAGPDPGNTGYAKRFAKDTKDTRAVSLITLHYYIGEYPFLDKERTKPLPASQAIDRMLSQNWIGKKYPDFYDKATAPIEEQKLPWRVTETNDILKGVTGASNSLASALWALDYLHWLALNYPACAGVNFHNTKWLKTGIIYLDKDGAYKAYPKAYGTRAFAISGRGRIQKLALSNPEKLNLTAYAVSGDDNALYITIVNKEHGPKARPATVRIDPAKFPSGTLETMSLVAANGDAGATTGITLGGDVITNHAPWAGKWSQPVAFDRDHNTVLVPASSALIIKIAARLTAPAS